MYDHQLHPALNERLLRLPLDLKGEDNAFYIRFLANVAEIRSLYLDIYAGHPACDQAFNALIESIIRAYADRSPLWKKKDQLKAHGQPWYLSRKLAGMSLYVDRFCGRLRKLPEKTGYLKQLGINLLHLMPLFESPSGESDGGYAVSDFRKVDPRFGDLDDLRSVISHLQEEGMYLMLDIVLNHTSHRHEWAVKAQKGDEKYQQYFYMYDDRSTPDAFEETMPEIFPESAPGSFTWNDVSRKWVMTVFHQYQWDLNYTNPDVFVDMLEHIFFYANLGVDILRIDAPAFIWKQIGTTCQNLPQAHALLRLIRMCTEVATPGMALLGEAIVAPRWIMPYFGTDGFSGRECHFAYNATQMALQWDALASGDVRIMQYSQEVLMTKPAGSAWINYIRCHDDIGLGYEDEMIQKAGYQPYAHRKFIKDYYSGIYQGSDAIGALFSIHPKTQDARISGSLASLCGLEKGLELHDKEIIDRAVQKMVMLHAHLCFYGGLPMIYSGDEVACINDYSYLQDPGKDYDNRWMHRPMTDWKKNDKTRRNGTIEYRVYAALRKLLQIRSAHAAFDDNGQMTWLDTESRHVAGFLRWEKEERIYCLFNYSRHPVHISWYIFKNNGHSPARLTDLWTNENVPVGQDHDYYKIPPYGFRILACPH